MTLPSTEPSGRNGVEQTLTRARQLLAADPNAALREVQGLLRGQVEPRVLRFVAEVQRRLGDVNRSEAAELMAIQASMSDPRVHEAATAEQQRRSADAARIAADLLKSEPDNLLARTILAEALVSMRQLAQAEEALRPVIERAPTFTQARLLLAKCLKLQCRLREAIEQMNNFLRHRPNNPPAWQFLADCFTDVGDFEQAAAVYERLLATEDRQGEVWLNYGLALRFAGRKDDAETAFRRALALDGSNGAAWWSLTNMAPEAIGPADTTTMEQALAWLLENDDEVDDASQIHVALGTLLDRSGHHERAFGHISAGKVLLSRARPYDPQILTTQIDNAITSVAADSHVKQGRWGAEDQSPIFIVGMPRSGSTLVERIIGSHSLIEATGELPIIPRMVDELDGEAGFVGGHQQLLTSLGEARIRQLGRLYLEKAREFRRTDKPFFTDKLHMNWRHLKLIRLILPQAKIIDVRRDAVDCCWSNFKTHFARGHPASNDLAHIGQFYRDYVRFTDHMASISPTELLPVRYETVVDDIEVESRRILSFLGLEFERSCLKFHTLKDPVATASAEQVRRPLNRQGIGASTPYRQWLGPLIDALGPLAVRA